MEQGQEEWSRAKRSRVLTLASGIIARNETDRKENERGKGAIVRGEGEGNVRHRRWSWSWGEIGLGTHRRK